MQELDNARQQAIARLMREWIRSETFRRNLRELLGLKVDEHIPEEHRSLLDELDRQYDQWQRKGGSCGNSLDT